MNLEIIIVIFVVILLFLVYKELVKMREFLESKKMDESEIREENDKKYVNFQNWLYEKFTKIEEKVGEMSDIATIENPAWGEDSASSLKRKNLITLYSRHLVEKEKLSQKDALLKARFVISNFEGGITDDLSRDFHFKVEVESEKELLLSDFFKKEVTEKVHTLKAKDIFEPLWIGIKIKKYKKGDELLQNTKKAFESHSGKYGYQNYIEDFAIVSKLVHLGIFEEKKEKNEARKTMSGHSFYILKEDNLEKLRKVIFVGDAESSKYYTDTYFESEHSKDERIKLPFQQPFEF